MSNFKKTMLAGAMVALTSQLFVAPIYAAASTNARAITGQRLVDQLSQQLAVTYQVVDNQTGDNGIDCSALGADFAACFKANIILNNHGDSIKANDWQIYFHSIRMILAVDNKQFKITHLTGDLHKIEPTDKFK